MSVSGGGAAGADAAAAPPAAVAAAAASEGVAAGAVMVAEATEGEMTMGGGSCDGGRAMVFVFGLWAAGLAGGVSLCGVVWKERLREMSVNV